MERAAILPLSDLALRRSGRGERIVARESHDRVQFSAVRVQPLERFLRERDRRDFARAKLRRELSEGAEEVRAAFAHFRTTRKSTTGSSPLASL